jgi:hypothetical protein
MLKLVECSGLVVVGVGEEAVEGVMDIAAGLLDTLGHGVSPSSSVVA